jgi:hypothetical protein
VGYFYRLHKQIKRKDMTHIFLVGKSSESYQLDARKEDKGALDWVLQIIFKKEVQRTGSGSYPMVGINMSCSENSGSHARELVTTGLINQAFCKNFHPQSQYPYLNYSERHSIHCILDESMLRLFLLRRIFLREKEMY